LTAQFKSASSMRSTGSSKIRSPLISGSSSREWRLRVGDWRVRFTFDDEQRVIVVLRVLPRGRAYRR
jgi:mRNA-degrading endonuclease RelE of RelBE toxin-antitoxin system